MRWWLSRLSSRFGAKSSRELKWLSGLLAPFSALDNRRPYGACPHAFGVRSETERSHSGSFFHSNTGPYPGVKASYSEKYFYTFYRLIYIYYAYSNVAKVSCHHHNYVYSYDEPHDYAHLFYLIMSDTPGQVEYMAVDLEAVLRIT